MNKRIFSIFLVLVFGLTSAACQTNTAKKQVLVPRDCAAFTATTASLPSKSNDTVRTMDVCYSGSDIIFLRQITNESGTEAYCELVWTDETGKVQSTREVRGQTDYFYGTALVAFEDTVTVLGNDSNTDSVLISVSKDDTIPVEVTPLPFDEYIWDACFVDDTWVFLGSNTLITMRDGAVVSEQEISGSLLSEQIVGNGGTVSLPFNSDKGSYIGVLDANSGSFSEKDASFLMSLSMTGWCFSQNNLCISTTDGIYRINAEKGQAEEILSWNDTDMPPSSYVYNITKDYVLNDDLVVRVVSPTTADQQDEYLILTHSDKKPGEGKTILTIGGYGVASSPLIQYAVYQFNMTNDTYRIELKDYNKLYPLGDMGSYTRATTQIIAAMSSGESQDIFYGMTFRFSELGKSGLVLDMMPYLASDGEMSEKDWVAGIFDLMKTDDSLYGFFPGFSVAGYVTNTAFFDNQKDVTIGNINKISSTLDSNQSIIVNAKPEDLVRGAILYAMDDFTKTGEFAISEEQLSEIIQYAKDNGTSAATGGVDDSRMYITGEAAMLYAFLFCPQDYSSYEKMSSTDTIFVGYPSIEDSGRVCKPGNMLGISAGTQYPDACWEFIKIMMSDEVQQKAVELNMIPVSQQAFDSLLNKAMHPELRTAAENVALDLNDKSAVTEESIEHFKEMVASLNCLDYYDVTLSTIIDEECAPCLAGDKSPADIVDVLNSRINLYLKE